MGMHDRFAGMAWASDRTPEEFHAKAQMHANGTWAFGVIALVVWYFAGWIWALLPAALGVITALQSISCTKVAVRMEELEAAAASRRRT